MKQNLHKILLALVVSIITHTAWSAMPQDTIKGHKPRYTVRRTTTETTDDVKHRSADLRDPSNLKTEVTYDEKDGTYSIGTVLESQKGNKRDKKTDKKNTSTTPQTKTKKDDKNATNVKMLPYLPANATGMTLSTSTSYITSPVVMTPKEYMDWSLRKSMAQYYRQRNQEQYETQGKSKFDFTDMRFSLGPAEKIFGPGGIQIKTQGSAEFKMGGNMKYTDNPTLAASRRKSFGFDFDMKINLTVNAKVGDKVDMNINYNTDASFDYDQQNLKLKYEGKEDEIVKLVEAGNVSMPSNMSLIPGISSLFGLRTDLQFGKLKMQAVVSQKKSASKSVSGNGGSNTNTYEFSATNYEENKHFYLGHHFRQTYDQNMKSLPTIASGISIKRIEVWVTNKTGTTTNTRNIIALTDLAEHDVSGTSWTQGASQLPDNSSNNEYSTLAGNADIRDITKASLLLENTYHLEGSVDYDKLQSAKLLSSNDYHLNAELGTITLNTTLQPDDILAVAYEYVAGGKTYKVGEFASDITDTNSALLVKMIHGSATTPQSRIWKLMMRNVYSLGATSTQKDKFKLDIKYQSDSTGLYLSYLPYEHLRETILLRAMGLDRLDAANKPYPNGQFDYVEGYTIYKGRIYFPVAEPFGQHLYDWIISQGCSQEIAQRYSFPELYSETRTTAKQMAEKNKFLLTGEYKGSSANEINLGAYNLAPGSVTVTAGGVTLTENSDYTVDYASGIVTIINQSIINAGTKIDASVESNDTYGMQRKTFLGFNFDYEASKSLTFGGTVQYLVEQPLTTKISMGNEALKNVLWGAHISWKHKAQWLTNLIDKIPFINATRPSQITFDGQVAQLIAGMSSSAQGGASYIDDFEDTKKKTSLIQPTYWQLASTPESERFPESKLTNDITYGYNRALLAWYCIDPIFTNRSSTLTPSHIKSDLKQLSNHYVRGVYELELYPNKSQTSYNSNSLLNVLNLAYYPKERGPYNLTRDVDPSTGELLNPTSRWGGMMRKIDNTDFESQNIEYIEFWLMDPFHYDKNGGGDLYFNLGEISEDILKDGKKSYESGLPIDGNADYIEETKWGRVPRTNSITYAFNNSEGAREKQDLGLNGLSDEDEKLFDEYARFYNDLESGPLSTLPDTVRTQLMNDPANDNYHYFRGDDYDQAQVSILDRYKRINMPQGNSPESGQYRYETAWKATPDVEDINTDYTLNEKERYWEYRLSIRPNDLANIGNNYVSDIREASVTLRDGSTDKIKWYLIRIPLNDSNRKSVGGITDFSSIRFMRMYMTNFADSVVLRFGTLDLVHGDWRSYNSSLYTGGGTGSGMRDFTVTAVNIEENNDRKPVNYVVPPGISRISDTSSGTMMESNEQALALTVKQLSSNDACAVYKNVKYDMRKYKHIQLFTHANTLDSGDADHTDLRDGEVSVFIRLGSDYRNNYYEYEVPLQLTPVRTTGKYSNNSPEDREKVWPEGNMLDFDLDMLVELKKLRNKNNISYNQLYTSYDPDKPNNRIAIIGNPSLGEVKTIMIGIRNHAAASRSVEVWVNELRLQEFTNEGGWAAQGTLNIQLSDIGSFNANGKIVTAGYGGIEQTVQERTDKDSYQYQFTTNLDLGKLLPDKAKVSVPFYYSYSKDIVKPKYNPLDTDMKLSDALEAMSDEAQRDSLSDITISTTTSKNLSISGARVNIVTNKKHPMPYDPANLTFSYSQSSTHKKGETTVYEKNTAWKASLKYAWNPNWKNWEPFKNWKTKSKWAQIIKEQNIALAPQSITFSTDLGRTYYELQERDVENSVDSRNIPVVWSSQYLWNRQFSLRWDLFKALHFTFQSATHAEVEQPNRVVNKELYPDDYTAWKDSVKHSLAHFGRPLDYSQSVTMSYKLPINKIPCFDWITADGTYNSTYSWKRGAELQDGSSMGNTINTHRSINLNGKLAMETLYNHSKFLKEANKKFAATNARSEANKKVEAKRKADEEKRKAKEKEKELLKKAKEEAQKSGEPLDSVMARLNKDNTLTNAKGISAQKDTKKTKKGFSQVLKLLPDTSIILTHNQKAKRVWVRIQDEKGHEYKVKTRRVDENKIEVKTRPEDTIRVRFNVIPKPKASEQKWYPYLQAAARLAMSLRSVSISYKDNYNLALPGFMPEAGDLLGQRKMGANGFAPGLDFAFGLVSDSYIDKAYDNGWLSSNDQLSTPATSSKTGDLQIKATLEPITDLKIDLNASRTMNQSKSIQYMYSGSPTTRTGSFSITTISIGSAFEGIGNVGNGYQSNTFDKFCDLLPVYQNRVEQQYIGAKDPTGKTYVGSGGTATSTQNNTPVNRYSGDVMIPAFLAAYCGGGTTRSLDIFPAITRMLPNWSLTYKGLGNLPWIRDHFKSVNITHGYKSLYTVGSYNSYTAWYEYMSGRDLGFISSVGDGSTDSYRPNSCYDISTVSINESFSPLAGLNVTLRNNMTFKAEYRTTRVLALSMTSAQLNETRSNDLIIGWGWKINDFKLSTLTSLFGRNPNKGTMRSTAKNKRSQNNKTNTTQSSNTEVRKKNTFAHSLNMRFDFSIRSQSAVRRDIQTRLSEATSGNKAIKTAIQIDYAMSRFATMSIFYDRQSAHPLLSSSAYPTVTQDFGMTMKFSLTR